MRARNIASAGWLLLVLASAAVADSGGLTFTTLSITPYAIEGLTGDAAGNLYTTGRAPAGTRCPVWRVDTNAARPVTPVQVGSIPNLATSACNPSGITFDASGNLYIADAAQGGVIWQLSKANMDPTTPYATGVPGTNGIAFDRWGDLWTGDGTTGLGRVWGIAPGGGACEPTFNNCIELFRIPPLVNNFGVGRQVSTVQPGGATNPQPLVANGVAFTQQGDMLIADTARGAIWRVVFDKGRIASPMGCDVTYAANTLCLSNVFVQHPLLEGVDGFVLDVDGNIWNAVNERNAIVTVTRNEVLEVFRNPVNNAALRNAVDTAAGNSHILELPTSPFLLGTLLCVAQSDGDRRDNSPRTAGEINGGAANPGARGKISCADQRLNIPGLPLPVH